MERRLNEIYDADKLFYYYFSENESCNLVLRLVLKERIDQSILKKALNRTLKRYPNFRQKPVLDSEGYLYSVDNDLEAEVYPYDPDPVNFGTRDTNGYLFRVMYEGSTLWISVFHGVCDGRGYMMFARTLLYYYLTLAGHPVRNEEGRILTEDVPADHTEMADPFDIPLEREAAANPFKPTGEENIFLIPGDKKGIDECRHYSLYRYVLDADKLVSFAREAGCTVDTYFHLLMAKMIRENYDTGGKMIAGMGAVDLRPFYDSRYLQNMRELFWIYYPDNFFELPDRAGASLIQRLFKNQQLTRDNFDGVLKESREGLKETLKYPFSYKPALKIMRDNVWKAPELMVSYFTTNLNRLDLGPDMDAHVARADVYAPAIFQCPGLLLLTQGNETVVNLTQRGYDRYFALKLRETFEKKGLLISAEMGKTFENDKLKVDLLHRDEA
ncbi:MAG: hypothetical protein IJ137_12370 [Eubacterium sp.]|nr:hypothetical protein [Eubacterium sp.]